MRCGGWESVFGNCGCGADGPRKPLPISPECTGLTWDISNGARKISVHSEGRERSGRHALGASRRTRKRRFRKNHEPQNSRCSRRKQPGARRSGGAGTERACAQGVARGDRSFVETRSSRAQTSSPKQRQRLHVTQITNQTSFPIYAALSLAAACPLGHPELEVVESGQDGRLTVKEVCRCARSGNTSTSTHARVHSRAFSGQVWPDCVPVHAPPAPRQRGPIKRHRRHQI
jgi:hypothetical protein